MSTTRDKHILIVGGGTFGLSTALWLLRNQFRNVTVIDSHHLPSQISAGYDINKIIQSNYPKGHELTNTLAIEALEGWQTDPVFFPHFNESGIVYATCRGTDSTEYEELQSMNSESKNQNRKFQIKHLETPDDFKNVAPQLTGELTNWKGHYQVNECGWAHAKNALISAGREIQRLGGKYIIGEVDGLIYNEDNTKVLGIKTSGGKEYLADTVVISAGASSVKLIDFQNQLLAKCWTVGHIKLTPEEAESFRGMPVICNLEKGFFFEPDFVNQELKICNEFPGYTHYTGKEPNTGKETDADNSIPIYKSQIPLEAERDIRLLLHETLPQFEDRPLVDAKICWCTDTPDRNFLICEHPTYSESLVLATGDSGHGFKHMPNIGKYIARLITYGPGGLDQGKRKYWRWRPETAKDRIQDRFGGDGHVNDLKDVKSWTQLRESIKSMAI